MKRLVTVKNVTIGEGIPKICVPMVGKTLPLLMEEAEYLQSIDADIIEWRVDFFEDVEEVAKVKEVLFEIRSRLPEKPLIFTFRSVKEGGEKEISLEYYLQLNKEAVETGLVDIIDIELMNADLTVKTLINIAHANQVHVILSNHDFEKTPSKEEIISRLRKAQELGGDLPKIAVMPTNVTDVITLLEATVIMSERYADRPIITMSMAGKGMVSRISGELFGSALTFGAAKQASAPGQVDVSELRTFLTLFHNSL